MLYHGSSVKVEEPDLGYSRRDIDFGIGFYLTEDPVMAKKWACNKNTSILNTYQLDLDQLCVKKLRLDEEWLNYVIANRTQNPALLPFDDSDYDVIVGATADDKLYGTIDLYMDGVISAEKAIQIMNCMNHNNQVVVKSKKGLRSLKFLEHKELYGLERENMVQQFQADKKMATQRTKELMRVPDTGKIFYEEPELQNIINAKCTVKR